MLFRCLFVVIAVEILLSENSDVQNEDEQLVRSSRICSVLADCVGFWLRWSASTNHEDSPVSTALPELPHSRQ